MLKPQNRRLVKTLGLGLLIMISAVTVQAQKGIEFTRGLTWAQIKEKAKAENRYIFVDTYTTWCLPCKVMEKEIFPQPAVGEFFNKNFINVAVQLDVTKRDNDEVKRWYNDARKFQTTYKIESFPTYLFFAPSGELVHTINGATATGEEFIAKAKPAIDPATQFNVLKKQFEAGKREPEFLLRLIRVSRPPKFDHFTKQVINEFLKTETDMLQERNIRFLVDATSSSTDPGFRALREHPEKIDAVAGAGTSADLIRTIAFEEIGVPYIREGGRKVQIGAGMCAYQGELKKSVEWSGLRKKYEEVYPELAAELTVLTQCEYFDANADWPAFARAVSSYISGYPAGLSNGRLLKYCNDVWNFCSDPGTQQEAIRWTQMLLDVSDRKHAGHLYANAILLYKTGQKEQAIRVIEEASKMDKAFAAGYQKAIEKMKNGDPLWIQ